MKYMDLWFAGLLVSTRRFPGRREVYTVHTSLSTSMENGKSLLSFCTFWTKYCDLHTLEDGTCIEHFPVVFLEDFPDLIKLEQHLAQDNAGDANARLRRRSAAGRSIILVTRS